VVALTGGIGSGKSTVAEGFSRRGIVLVDADAIAHTLTGPGGNAMAAITAAFGLELVTNDGALDRQRMRQLAFSDDQQRLRLEAILHPMIRQRTDEAIRAANSPYVMWVVPLLFEAGGDGRDKADRILLVDCPEDLQVQRVMARSKLSDSEVRAIMARQVSRATRLSKCDDVIDNSAPLDTLDAAIGPLHERYLEFSQARV
jgi:dephospho-CoA kinase